YRVAWLVRQLGIDPASIVAVTFTNKAAGEMSERIEELLGVRPLPSFVGTFHRFALGLLRRYGSRVGVKEGFAIFDRDDQIALVKKVLKAEGLADTSYPPRSVLASIGAAKNRLLDPEAYALEVGSFYEQKVAALYRAYQAQLRKAGAVDFDDMLRLSVRLLDEHPDVLKRLRDGIHYLLVDEFQDTNHAQMRLILTVIGGAGNLTAVGDEDQGIYRWRGADLDNVLEFEKYFAGATIRKLERNYRSTQNILSAAGSLVEHNRRRRGKRLWTEAVEGNDIELYRASDDQDEARWIARTLGEMKEAYSWLEMAVLVRTNAQTRALEERFLQERIPYDLVGGMRFYERAEIKDLVAYLRVLRNPRNDFALQRILNQPPRGIGKATRQILEQEAAAAAQSLWDAILQLEPARFPARSGQALIHFRQLIEELSVASEDLPLPALIDRLLERTDYAALFRKKDAEAEAKRENIREFVTAAQEFAEGDAAREEEDQLRAFLDHASLVADIDEWRQDRGVSVMTLHSAKGLEFPVVVVAGLEDGLLPHFNSQGAPEDLEEERRLLYVGMTRAEHRLFMTHCRRRRIAGRYQERKPSSFLDEIPQDCLEISESPRLFVDERTQGVYRFFGHDRGVPAILAASSQPDLYRGRRVRHATLGDGVVLATEGSGEDSKLTIYFDQVGKRKLVVKYAALEYL
ncbi:MAG: UvrD-helicase domain-containing protein, partial [Acidobacteriota bacterium]|nr:UvrD-helicase domain-containing protein [Acidobacteriota bacterium]